MKKTSRIAALVLLLVLLVGGISSNASYFYTYTYDITGFPLKSPEYYRPYKQIDSVFMGLDEATPLKKPTDITVDKNGKVYIADPENNRIVVLSKYWKVVKIITTFRNEYGNADSLAAPNGLYICKDGEIYVADTGNSRVVVFDKEYNFLRSYRAPESDVFEEGSSYTPIALAVDDSKRIYVVSSTANEGILSLNADGSFAAFIGAQKVIVDAFQLFWRKFMSAEQRAKQDSVIPTPYNNIDIDEKGFVYVTIAFDDEYASAQQASTRSGSGDYAPVKKLNASGKDIMRRNGFFGPSGEVRVTNSYTKTYEGVPTGPSTIVDVALGQQETWSILDQKRSHIFTYDKSGNLLAVFGDFGSQLGNFKRGVGLCYQDLDEDNLHYLLVLDSDSSSVVIYERTEYGEVILTALRHTNEMKYDEAADDWLSILRSNNNYDAAYVGIGENLFNSGDWQGAMKYYKSAFDIKNYSKAFKQYRKEIVSKILILIVVAVVAFVVAISLFFKWANKKNRATALKIGKKSFGEEVLYAFHIMFHPFDGFWDLKHEKRGSVRGALFWIAVVILAFTYQSAGQSYLFLSGYVTYSSILGQIVSIIVPLLLFVVANWCLTTLFEGEGSLKDIFVAIGYAVAPLSFMIVFSTILSNFVTLSEVTFVNLISGIAWVWVGILVFFGIMVTHDFTLSKNIIMTLSTILVMAVIMFIMVLFSGLIIRMLQFVTKIVTEITYMS